MVMRARKNFVVVAYDVSDDRRRFRVAQLLEKVGIRVNYSVFECMLTDAQYEKLRHDIGNKINLKEDSVVYYPICVDCYTKIVYQPDMHRQFENVMTV